MLKVVQSLNPLIVLLIATTLEASGDAVVRMGIYQHGGMVRAVLFLVGAALLFGYGVFLNLAPFEFGRVVGLYIATLLVVWQFINYFAFRALPTPPILLGGALVVVGGLIMTFWRAG
jgi:small multidrug resistance family-3 protein